MPNVTNFHPKRNDSEWRSRVRKLLENSNGKFLFQKADGSLREMTCTLKSSVVPETKGTGRTSTSVMCVYDLEKQGWRSINYDRIVDFKVLVE